MEKSNLCTPKTDNLVSSGKTMMHAVWVDCRCDNGVACRIVHSYVAHKGADGGV